MVGWRRCTGEGGKRRRRADKRGAAGLIAKRTGGVER